MYNKDPNWELGTTTPLNDDTWFGLRLCIIGSVSDVAYSKILFQTVQSLKTIKNFRRLKVRKTKILNSEEIFVKPILDWILSKHEYE